MRADNPSYGYPANGLQAMAVAPIVNGSADTSRIIIAYKATVDLNDWVTDIQTVVGGSKLYVPLEGGPAVESQVISAKRFADSIIQQYQGASFAVTGISLGGYLSMSIGAQEQIPVVAYVGPDPSNSLTPEQIAFVQAHPNLYFNIRNTFDLILGAYGGDKLGTAHYYYDGQINPMSAHNIGYKYNADGSIAYPAAQTFGVLLNTLVTAPDPLISTVASLGTNALNYINTNVRPITDPIVASATAAVTASVNAVTSATTQALAAVNTAVTNTVASINTAVTSAVTTVATISANAVTNVVNTIAAVLPKWW